MTNTHGGKRAGAGRKPVSELGTVAITVTLTPDLLTVAGTLGDGNISAGIRAALAPYADDQPPTREVQIWRWQGAHYVVLWQGAMVAACGPLSLEQAQAMRRGAVPLPEQWQPAVADALDDALWRGETERVDGEGQP